MAFALQLTLSPPLLPFSPSPLSSSRGRSFIPYVDILITYSVSLK